MDDKIADSHARIEPVTSAEADGDDIAPKPKQLSQEEAEQEAALAAYAPGSALEKRLVRKLDFILLPVLWWMYVLAYIDRGKKLPLWRDERRLTPA